jgi:CubicO group peptidase (beta-lactamase class C family)
VLKDDVVVYEHYDRINTEKSVYATFSISKSVTGLLCGILVEQGRLDTNDLVSSYVPEVKGSAYEIVTVR